MPAEYVTRSFLLRDLGHGSHLISSATLGLGGIIPTFQMGTLRLQAVDGRATLTQLGSHLTSTPSCHHFSGSQILT